MEVDSYSREALEKLSKQELIKLLLDKHEHASANRNDSASAHEGQHRQTHIDTADQAYFYQLVAENFPNGAIAIVDRKGRYQFVAGKELQKLGKTPEDFLGKAIVVLPVSAEVEKKLHQTLHATLQGKSCKLEISFNTNAYIIHTLPLIYRHGKVEQILVFLQNITDQKKALREVQYQKAQLESLIENVDDAIWSVDTENTLMMANSAFYQAIKRLYKTDIKAGQKIHEQVTYENFMLPYRRDAQPILYLQQWQKCQERALQGEKVTTEIHYPFRFKDISIRVSLNPVFDTDKKVIGITFFVHDVTDFRKALSYAQKQEVKFKALAENIPGIVYITRLRPKYKSLFISNKVEFFTGYPAEVFLREERSIKDLIHPEDIEGVRQDFIEAQQKQSAYHFVYRLKHKQGHYTWVKEHGVAIEQENGIVLEGVILDISTKKKYEEQLEHQNQHLRKVNAELDHFAYSVSHDLRAPLTSAMGLLTLLQMEKQPLQQEEYIRIINDNLRKLDAFIQDIILLSKNVRTDLEVSEIDFKEVIHEVIESQKYGTEAEKIDIDVEVRQDEKFYSDRRRLKIILNNLVSNALKYSFLRRERPFAQVKVSVENATLTMSVSDNGIGIQEVHLPKIFEMFYRATDRKSGTGLGLYLVKETLDKLGGNIEVESTYGEGTTFKVQLPEIIDKELERKGKP
ncbi:PAS domain S-box-containing protein [Catalinimonas alkaloidigena]|uniref:PAS domain-containing sensor histidine kinase n=1 Tax=Catalinimonas alkaloidigena TaxID=1075417 RepID=UPI00240572A7|nr:PAS domain-containing sensor histidine kinase [Catalinimonas alkaloidigena]MDF9799398.1 PAS domain S-box-containing protein [Catalinimonas alkaloidigena]